MPPTLHSPLVPLWQPPLCRPEHEYFAQNAVCYITHIIIGKSRQRILSPRTHTHTHTYEELARSLMQTTPPISGQRPPTQRALMWQLLHQQQEPRPRYAHEAGHGQAALPPLHLFYLLLLCQATPLQFSTTPCPVSLWSVGMRSLLGAAVVVGGRRRRRRLCSISKYERIIQTYIYRCAYVCACACVCVSCSVCLVVHRVCVCASVCVCVC